jgi:hypothetical protein
LEASQVSSLEESAMKTGPRETGLEVENRVERAGVSAAKLIVRHVVGPDGAVVLADLAGHFIEEH